MAHIHPFFLLIIGGIVSALETRTVLIAGLPRPDGTTYPWLLPNIVTGEFSMIPPSTDASQVPAEYNGNNNLVAWKTKGNIVGPDPIISHNKYLYFDNGTDSINQLDLITGQITILVRSIGCPRQDTYIPALCDGFIPITLVRVSSEDMLFFQTNRPSVASMIVGDPNATFAILRIPLNSIPSGISVDNIHTLASSMVLLRWGTANCSCISYFSPYSSSHTSIVSKRIQQQGHSSELIYDVTASNILSPIEPYPNTESNIVISWGTQNDIVWSYPTTPPTALHSHSRTFASQLPARYGAVFWITSVSPTHWRIVILNPLTNSESTAKSPQWTRGSNLYAGPNASALFYSDPFVLGNYTTVNLGYSGTSATHGIIQSFSEDPVYPSVFYVHITNLKDRSPILYQITLDDREFGGNYSPDTVNTLPAPLFANRTLPVRVNVVADFSEAIDKRFMNYGQLRITEKRMASLQGQTITNSSLRQLCSSLVIHAFFFLVIGFILS